MTVRHFVNISVRKPAVLCQLLDVNIAQWVKLALRLVVSLNPKTAGSRRHSLCPKSPRIMVGAAIPHTVNEGPQALLQQGPLVVQSSVAPVQLAVILFLP